MKLLKPPMHQMTFGNNNKNMYLNDVKLHILYLYMHEGIKLFKNEKQRQYLFSTTILTE